MKKLDFAKWQAILKKQSKTGKLFLAFLGAGMLFLFIANLGGEKSAGVQNNSPVQNEAVSEQEYLRQLEASLSDILSSIEGVGEVKLMISLEAAGEQLYAQTEKSDETQTQTGENSYSTRSSLENEYVLVDTENGRGALLTGSTLPVVQGVVVVCTGADSPSVAMNVTEVICVALGITSNRVCIKKII